MEVYVDVDEFEILREMTTEELQNELRRRNEAIEEGNFTEDNITKLKELMLYKTPEQTLAFLDKLLFPR